MFRCAWGGAVVGDPAQSISHASLMIQIGSTYYDLFNVNSEPISFVVPAGVTNQLCRVLLNYSAITGANATGTVKATIQWCRDSAWCYMFDFTVSQQGFTIQQQYNESQSWQSGSGFLQAYASQVDAQYSFISRIEAADFTVTRIEGTVAGSRNFGNIPANEYCFVGLYNQSGTEIARAQAVSGSTPGLFAADVNVSNARRIDFGMGTQQATMNGRIVRLTLYGLGSNPFGTTNC